MSLFNRLRNRQDRGEIISVAVAGSGMIGRGIVRQINLTPGMRTALIVNRTVEHGVNAFRCAGRDRDDIVASDKPRDLQAAIDSSRAAVTTRLEAIRDLDGIDAAVEVTGAVEYGARMALCAIDGGKHVIMMNAETDATVGCALKRLADVAGVIYTNSDGDQPGVLKRLTDYVEGVGFQIVAAVNCKGFMDRAATPDSIREWAIKQNTSLPMTTAFTDGTKMNIENAVLCNATGLVPEVRGMHGVTTDLAHALEDCMKAFRRRGVVDYTLGGNFAGGVFVIGHGDDPVMIQPYMKYLKMGDGPNYMFYRPYHLCHLETPLSIAEAVLDHEPTIAPLGRPIVDVVAIAKRDLVPGDLLDGIGGYTCYGEVEVVENCYGMLPIGLADRMRVLRPVRKGEPIPMHAVELDDDSLLMQLRGQQQKMPQVRVA
jgi:predicted homoserine dehydrogenase-like protein